ncbi:T9SS sorting signal type C domain-containing protein [Flavobacterium pectinovorum]|uniref:T9SS sorting signal type C domain-containing protein n=1 Tax=Flavobacterium pectinovorum TaxID=29533 RepID=UPI002660173F|nr:T9SS sorting signal type C domain-containing protein [Flavobacterium pectinovorum]WKL46531.1 T9SS sorting signal type C domain-containing protein [Flavobacterium pectinovorum]
MIRKLLLFIIFIIFPVLTFGQSIWTNPITGSNPGQTNPYTTGETRNANISVSGIGRTGVSGANGNNSYTTGNWNNGFTTNKYIEFILTPNNGYKIDFISLQYTGQTGGGGSGTAPSSFAVRSSVDNFTADIGSAVAGTNTISLSGASYQNIGTAITFRIYAWGGTNNSKTYAINDFTFNGTVCSSPVTTGASICQGGTGSLTSTTNGVTANTFTGSWNAATDATASIPTTSMNNNTNCGFVAGIVRNYTATSFTVSTTGVYTFKMTDTNAYDGMAYIYSGNFTPGTCPGGGNWIIGDDDNSGLNAEPRMTPTLIAGVVYTLVSTTYNNSSGTYSGDYTWTVTPPAGGQVTTSPVSWYTAATGGTAIGGGSPFNPVGVAGSGLANTNTVGTTTYYASLGGSCARTPTAFVINGDTPTTSLGTYTFCIDNSMTQTTANATAGQYALVNVVKGYTYTFAVGNVFAGNNEKLNILNAATDLEVSPTANNTSASGATISNWVAPFSGQIKVVLSTGSCSNIGIAGTGGIALTLNSIGNTQETQNEFGTNTWVGHIYNAGGVSPEPFATANYAGSYNIATEAINEGFGGDANCFPVYSNGVQRASIFTEGFAVRYKMKTTKSGCYLITMTGDDGIRLFLNGTKVFDRWVEQGSTTYNNVLVNLDGDDDLVFDYYENAGGNVVAFSMTAFNAGANTITAPATVTFCSNGDPAVIEGSLQYNSNDANFQNPQLNFQWQVSTDGINYTDISGATGRTYDPPAIVNNSTSNIVRRFKRLVTLNTGNVPNINSVRTACLYNESNIVTITTTPTAVISATTASTCTGDAFTVTPTGTIPAGTTYSWGIPTVTGGITGGTASTGTPTSITGTLLNPAATAQTATYTVTPASSGCAGATFTVTVTVNPLPTPTFTAQPAGSTCIGTSVTYTTQGAMSNYVWGFPGTAGTDYAIVSGGTSTDNTVTLRYLTAGSKVVTINYTNVPNGCTATSATSSSATTVNALPTAPSIAAQTEVNCTTSGSVTLNNLPAGNWTINQTGFASNAISDSGNSYTVTGLAAGTYRFTVSNGTCISAVSSDVTITNQSSTTWSGTGWSNDKPDASKAAIIAGAFTISSDLTACSLTINPGIAITVPSNYTLTVVNALTVSPTASLTFENHSSLVQVNDNAVNSGNIKYKRIAPKIRRGDFVYWSTPVTPQKLVDVSPLTLGDKYFGYSGDNWVITNKNTVMKVGKGYIIRGPQTYSLTVKTDYPAEFNGVPNNGVILGETLTAGKPYLIGNPYPSALSAKKFLDQNITLLEGTLYFWTHNTPVTLTGVSTYTSDDYASYNLTGSTVVKERAISAGTPGSNNEEPSGFIGAGQSFFAISKAGGTVAFNNDMRLGAVDNTQFFKSASKETAEAHHVWLNMTNTQGVFKQMLVGYVQGATNEYEDRYDGVSFNANPYVDFYSVDNGNNYVIQGRALPFTDTDQVALGYNTTITGDFTISIDKTDGDLSSHAIYLEDKKTGVIHDLTASDYTFTTEKGTFTDRLLLRYTNKTLGTGDFENVENGLLVSVKEKTIKVTSSTENIKEVTVFDISGKLLYSKKKAGSTELQIQNLQSANQVLLVKVTLDNDFTTTKKIIFN